MEIVVVEVIKMNDVFVNLNYFGDIVGFLWYDI